MHIYVYVNKSELRNLREDGGLFGLLMLALCSSLSTFGLLSSLVCLKFGERTKTIETIRRCFTSVFIYIY